MGKSTVYFTDFRCPVGTSQLDKLKKLCIAAGIKDIDMDGKFVAIKMHFGELGNMAFLRPNYAKVIADLCKEQGGMPFLTDCNTLYPGSRKNALEHLDCANLNGFNTTTTGCQIIIGDGLRGTDEVEVPVVNGEYCKTALIGHVIMDADIFISLSHFKGHETTGFGGALKNIGIRKGLPEAEDQALVYLFMASTQMSADEYEKLLDDFIRQFPSSTDGYIRRANYYVAKGKDDQSYFDKAVADFNQALKVAAKKDDVYYNIAKLIYGYQLSKPETTYKDWTYDTALKNLRQAMAIDPLPVYTQLEGDILFAQQDYAGALAAYEKVNASNLASAASFFSAAKTKELLKADAKEVLALMDSCIARCPQPVTANFAPYLLERAQIYMNNDQARNAMLDYDAYYKAVNGQVNDLFYYYREQAALKARQYQRALDDIVKAVELSPKDLTYRAEHAVVNLRVGRYEESMKILNEILKDEPKYGEAYRLLGLCQIQLKKTDEACGNFNKAKELGDPNVDELIKKYCK